MPFTSSCITSRKELMPRNVAWIIIASGDRERGPVPPASAHRLHLLDLLVLVAADVEAGDLDRLAVADLPDAVGPDGRAVRVHVELDRACLARVLAVHALELGVLLERVLPVLAVVEIAALRRNAAGELPDGEAGLVEVRLVEGR